MTGLVLTLGVLGYVYDSPAGYMRWPKCEVVGIYVGTNYAEVRTREYVNDNQVTPLVQAMMEE